MSLKDSDSNCTLNNKTVHFTINNANFNATTDNGVAGISLNLNPGKYTIFSYFEGDDEYEGCNLTSQLNILPTIKSGDVTKYYKGSTKYTATFFDSTGNVLANKAVSIVVNGKKYSVNTNSNGVVNLPVDLKPGTYKIVATDPLTGYQLTTNFKILSTVSSANLNKVAGDSRKFTAKFFKSNGNPLAKKYIKFKLKGKVYKVKTNSKGQATLSLTKLKKGTYKIICYNTDGLSKSYTIKVFKRKASTKVSSSSYTFYTNETKEVKIKFTTGLNDYSNSGKVIKIKINGKTYSKKTDSNGIINFKLPSLKKGIYTIECKYAGTKYFKASKTTNKITIYDNRSTSLAVKSTKIFGYGAGTQLKIAYTAGGVPLIKKTVTLSVGGKTYTKTTDNKGIVYLPINLNIGNYTVNYTAKGDSKVDGAEGSCNIEVVKRNDSKISWSCGSSFKDSLQSFKVFLTDLKGNPISGGNVELTIDGETYTGTTNSKGYATIKTSVPIGKYKVSVKFTGSNLFLKSSTSKSVNVKLALFKNGLNEKNAKALSAYLKSSSNCKVGSKAIKKLVKSLTKGLTSKVDKAKAIFNYVRDTLSYSLYYNTHYGATGTLKTKKGNCVDHSHLLVSMFRTAGFNARYVHGVCKFNSGHTYGHVWTQVKIGNKWVVADATSYNNDLGKISNWNTKSYKIHAKYASLPF